MKIYFPINQKINEWPVLNVKPVVCVIPAAQLVYKEFCTPSLYLFFTCFNIISPMQVILAMRIRCYSSFHNCYGVFLTYAYYLVLIWYFLFNLQPEAIINILQKKKSQRNGVQHLAGVYHAMKQNPPKEKLVLKNRWLCPA
jgi:hypothetical protein